jgi:hypothetical protein
MFLPERFTIVLAMACYSSKRVISARVCEKLCQLTKVDKNVVATQQLQKRNFSTNIQRNINYSKYNGNKNHNIDNNIWIRNLTHQNQVSGSKKLKIRIRKDHN